MENQITSLFINWQSDNQEAMADIFEAEVHAQAEINAEAE